MRWCLEAKLTKSTFLIGMQFKPKDWRQRQPDSISGKVWKVVHQIIFILIFGFSFSGCLLWTRDDHHSNQHHESLFLPENCLQHKAELVSMKSQSMFSVCVCVCALRTQTRPGNLSIGMNIVRQGRRWRHNWFWYLLILSRRLLSLVYFPREQIRLADLSKGLVDNVVVGAQVFGVVFFFPTSGSDYMLRRNLVVAHTHTQTCLVGHYRQCRSCVCVCVCLNNKMV